MLLRRAQIWGSEIISQFESEFRMGKSIIAEILSHVVDYVVVSPMRLSAFHSYFKKEQEHSLENIQINLLK